MAELAAAAAAAAAKTLSDDTRPSLLACLGADVLTAVTTAAMVAPVVTVIDSTITMKAAGGQPLTTYIRGFFRPLAAVPWKLFLARPPRLVFAVYFGTYLTANCVDTISSRLNNQPAATVTASRAKFAATAVVSTGLTVYKDTRLAQLLGSQPRGAALPLSSLAIFTLRDAITIFACFNLPVLLAPHLSSMIATESSRIKTAQFMLPATIQFITTPIHLLGLDMHNRRGHLGVSNRSSRILRDVRAATLARIVRIVPAFGIGGVVNLTMRARLMNDLDPTA